MESSAIDLGPFGNTEDHSNQLSDTIFKDVLSAETFSWPDKTTTRYVQYGLNPAIIIGRKSLRRENMPKRPSELEYEWCQHVTCFFRQVSLMHPLLAPRVRDSLVIILHGSMDQGESLVDVH